MSKKNTLWLYGRNAVLPALQSGKREVYELWATAQAQDELKPFATVKVRLADKKEFEKKFPNKPHQGIAACVGPLPEVYLEDVTDAQVLVMLDQVSDPHNLGAILRSCDAFGAGGVIVQAKNSAPLTDVAVKAASGAAESVPLVNVANLSQAIGKLQQEGFWAVGLDGSADKALGDVDLSKGKTLIVMGSEGSGLRRLVAENCDELAKLPMVGAVESLNVSVACGVALYEVLRQKMSA